MQTQTPPRLPDWLIGELLILDRQHWPAHRFPEALTTDTRAAIELVLFSKSGTGGFSQWLDGVKRERVDEAMQELYGQAMQLPEVARVQEVKDRLAAARKDLDGAYLEAQRAKERAKTAVVHGLESPSHQRARVEAVVAIESAEERITILEEACGQAILAARRAVRDELEKGRDALYRSALESYYELLAQVNEFVRGPLVELRAALTVTSFLKPRKAGGQLRHVDDPVESLAERAGDELALPRVAKKTPPILARM